MAHLNQCTYAVTGNEHQEQYWRTCYSCFNDQNEGCCLNCTNLCHNGHQLGPLRSGRFFCDCGSRQMCVTGQFVKPLLSESDSHASDDLEGYESYSPQFQVSNICLLSSPCQHYVKINGEPGRMYGNEIHKYCMEHNIPLTNDHFKKYAF